MHGAKENVTVLKIVLQIRVPYRPTDVKLSALSADRDKLPSGKQILALTLTWVLVNLFSIIVLHLVVCIT